MPDIFALTNITGVSRRSITTEEHVIVVSRWAMVRFILGVLQIMGATMTLCFLLLDGVSKLAWWSVSGTSAVSLTSIFLFRVLKVGELQK